MKRINTLLAAVAATAMTAGAAFAGGTTTMTERTFNYDTDRDGIVTKIEYRNVIDAKRDFENIDRDYDSRLTRVEFDDDRFDDFDMDDDDYLDRDEYSDGMFNDLDRDRSGDLDEFEAEGLED